MGRHSTYKNYPKEEKEILIHYDGELLRRKGLLLHIAGKYYVLMKFNKGYWGKFAKTDYLVLKQTGRYNEYSLEYNGYSFKDAESACKILEGE